MIQCCDCEFFERAPNGAPILACDPYTNIKEPDCLIKWQLVKLDLLTRSHQATLDMYERLAPLQERMFKHVERELDEADDADRWKQSQEDEDDEDPFGV